MIPFGRFQYNTFPNSTNSKSSSYLVSVLPWILQRNLLTEPLACSLADVGFTDEHWIVLGAPAQDLDDVRVILVGDAADCVSLIEGQGASLAMAGAFILAEELSRARGDIRSAFKLRAKAQASDPEETGRWSALILLLRTVLATCQLSEHISDAGTTIKGMTRRVRASTRATPQPGTASVFHTTWSRSRISGVAVNG